MKEDILKNGITNVFNQDMDLNPHHAQLADGIEVFIGQGQKVGMGWTPYGSKSN